MQGSSVLKNPFIVL